METTQIELIDTLVRPALTKAFVYDVTDSEAARLLQGETIWARIMGESSPIHLTNLDTNKPRVALGWTRDRLDGSSY